jgi:hypothetical protein
MLTEDGMCQKSVWKQWEFYKPLVEIWPAFVASVQSTTTDNHDAGVVGSQVYFWSSRCLAFGALYLLQSGLLSLSAERWSAAIP